MVVEVEAVGCYFGKHFLPLSLLGSVLGLYVCRSFGVSEAAEAQEEAAHFSYSVVEEVEAHLLKVVEEVLKVALGLSTLVEVVQRVSEALKMWTAFDRLEVVEEVSFCLLEEVAWVLRRSLDWSGCVVLQVVDCF